METKTESRKIDERSSKRKIVSRNGENDFF